jgi:uncharacterized protein (TIGR02246 family)
MSGSLRWSVALLAAVVTAACRAAPPAGDGPSGLGLAPADEARVRAADSVFAIGANTGDVEKVASAYAEDATLMPPNAPPIRGRAAIRGFWNGLLQAYGVELTIGVDQLEGRGDLAYIVGHYRFVTTPKAKGTPALPPEDGKFVEVLKRQADGSWRYVVDMYSANSVSK